MKYSNIVILTGAGVSAESGIQTFRGNGGLWENHRIEEVATPGAFADNPKLVQRFYNERRASLLAVDIKPNVAHVALAELEQTIDKHVVDGANASILLVTQNIDNLHEQAGSKHIRHMHGELLKARCQLCGTVVEVTSAIDKGVACGTCSAVDSMRPHIVWFGEMPFYMDEIYLALSKADLFLSIGTSGNVYPAAGFVSMANEANAHTVEINLEASARASVFNQQIIGKATETLPEFVRGLISSE